MKNERKNLRSKRAVLMLLVGLVATLLMLGWAQMTTADDFDPYPPLPKDYETGVDRILTEAELKATEITRDSLDNSELLGGDLSQSSKDVDRDEVPAGNEVTFTIVISNSGDTQVLATMVDQLPEGLNHVSHKRIDEYGLLPSDPEFLDVIDNEITWQGDLIVDGFAEILITAQVDENFPVGENITNVAEIKNEGNDVIVSPSATFKVLEKTEIPNLYLPTMSFVVPDPPNITNLTSTRPNSENRFKLSWTGGPNATEYIVQQYHNPSFVPSAGEPNIIEYKTGTNSFLELQPQPSWRNDMYFRVRAMDRQTAGQWSDTINVIGWYYDTFTDPNSGWEVRRTTYKEKIRTFYEFKPDYGRLVLEVNDRYDWGIASPLAKAPKVPYVIEFDAKMATPRHALDIGMVFGGDMPGEPCPDQTGPDASRQQDLCFNHFYGVHHHWAGKALKLNWERTDRLVWCPNCGESPMKRKGFIDLPGQLKDVKNDGWNRHRIEVREDKITYYAGRPHVPNLTLQYEYDDTRWIHEPYFGVFAYTGEHKPAQGVYEYYSVRPLDS